MSRRQRGWQPKPVSDDEVRRRFERVARLWKPGLVIETLDEGEAVVRECRLIDHDAVLLVDWPGEPKTLGLHIGLYDTEREFYYGDPVGSFDEWIEFLDVYVTVSFGTGVVQRSARVEHDDHVDIREHLG